MAVIQYYADDVDAWVAENGEVDAYCLLSGELPGIIKKLDRLDKRIIAVLEEIQEVFPDAQYYTESGGFSLVLGRTHERALTDEIPQKQRSAWGGYAMIGDGDW